MQIGDGSVYYDSGCGLYYPQESVLNGIEQVEVTLTNTMGSLYSSSGRNSPKILKLESIFKITGLG